MLQTILAGLILTSVSSLAYLAYKHPKPFQRLSNVLLVIWAAIYIGIIIWSVALMTAKTKLLDVLEITQAKIARESIAELELPVTLTTLIFFAVYGFIVLLKYLPQLLEYDSEKGPEDPPTQKDK